MNRNLLLKHVLSILPTLSDGAVYAFVVPPDAGSLRMRSRGASPAETIGPFVDDRRALGLRVGRIGLGVGQRRIAVDAHLRPGPIDGWHGIEPGAGSRWTNGDAVLPADLPVLHGEPAFLDIEVAQAGPYLADVA